jgi:hypothetical protein
MHKRVIFLGVVVVIMLGQAACGPSEAELQATDAAVQAKTQEVLSAKTTKQAQFTANALATDRIKGTQFALETQEAMQTATAAVDVAATAEVQGTADAILAATADSAATATQRVLGRQTATAEAIASATSQAAPMLDHVTRLADDGYLTTTQGEFHALPNFDESWAQINWYWFFPTGYMPTDFVIRAHVYWDVASRIPDWATTGCGFVFRENGIPDHYLTYLGLDGYVYFSRYVKDTYALVGKDYYGKVESPQGEADITLAVEGPWVTFLVNGEQVLRTQDAALTSGNLDYTLVSGTNKDYGTHCRMTNVELWVIR